MCLLMLVTTTYQDDAVVPADIRDRYDWIEVGSAAAVLQALAPSEWQDILAMLRSFELVPNVWLQKGGNKGDLTAQLDQYYRDMGWKETRIDLEYKGYFVTEHFKRGNVNDEPDVSDKVESVYSEGYRVDSFKGRVVVDVEWNAKDGNLDRDLGAYRSWYEAGLIDGAVIILKNRLPLLKLARHLWTDYQDTLPEEERNSKLPIDLTTSTTASFDKAEMRLKRHEAGTCPVLVVGVTDKTWSGDPFTGAPL